MWLILYCDGGLKLIIIWHYVLNFSTSGLWLRIQLRKCQWKIIQHALVASLYVDNYFRWSGLAARIYKIERFLSPLNSAFNGSYVMFSISMFVLSPRHRFRTSRFPRSIKESGSRDQKCDYVWAPRVYSTKSGLSVVESSDEAPFMSNRLTKMTKKDFIEQYDGLGKPFVGGTVQGVD